LPPTPEPFGHPLFTGAFLIEVDGVEIGRFTEVSGLSVEVEVEAVAEGGQNHFSHQLPGRMSWPTITLARGVTKSDNLFEWLAKTSGDGFAGAGNKLERNSAAITLLSRDGQRLRSWEVAEAFPVKWNGPTFAASSTEAAEEELEIAHHGFRSTRP
jgi:phage tail-like protein